MKKKQIGIIGNSGKMGVAIAELLQNNKYYNVGVGFNRDAVKNIAIQEIFLQNDYIIDCSNAILINEILSAAISIPKPLIICTTGLDINRIQYILDQLAMKTILIVASNTSVGAYIQRVIVKQLAKILDAEYDIDIFEKHHRNKVDFPSGTANTLITDIISTKEKHYQLKYSTYDSREGKRCDYSIGIAAQRSGNIFGEHNVTFTSADEMITIKHTAFNRRLFARGVIKIIDWINNTNLKTGIYSMEDIIEV